jgi:hypothetical protein
MKSYTEIDELIDDFPVFFDKNDKTPKHAYFYKGTAFPVISATPYDTMKSHANDMIVEELKKGQGLTEQTNEYIKQLERIKKVLDEGSELPDLPENSPTCVLERHFNKPFDELMVEWVLCVCALTRLKKIKGKGLNGVLVITPKKK